MTDASMPNSAKVSVFRRLYVGNGAFDIIGKRKLWYVVFGAILLACLLSIVFRGFNLGIDFTGGTRIQMPAQTANGTISVQSVEDSFSNSLDREPTFVQVVGSGASATIQIRTETLDLAQVNEVKAALNTDLQPTGGIASISDSAVSASWGGEITVKALIALAVFFVAVMIFLAIYFEFTMAIAALVATLHDVLITAGVYSIVGFEVSPATVIGLLTILGFSLYDTVVVFDKVKENTRGILSLTRRTYAEAANLAVNQTLMRSINTSLIALLPVLGLLAIGVGLLGVGTLKDLALVQLTGMLVGALSSIFIATPVAVDLKLRDPRYRNQAKRVLARRAAQASKADSEPGPTEVSAPLAEHDKSTASEQTFVTSGAHSRQAQPHRNRPTGKKRR